MSSQSMSCSLPCLAAILLALLLPDPAAAQRLRLASVNADGIVGATATHPSVSADGRWVAFCSTSPALVPGDTNGRGDVFLKDMHSGEVRRINLGPGGTQQSLAFCLRTAMSDDGTRVLFSDTSTGLLGQPPLTEGSPVYVYNRTLDQISLVSAAADGTPFFGGADRPARFAPGSNRHVIFESEDDGTLEPGTSNLGRHVYLKDLETGAIQRLSTGSDGPAFQVDPVSPFDTGARAVTISADLSRVAYEAKALNAFAGDLNGSTRDVVFRDLPDGAPQLGGVHQDGSQPPGGSIVFEVGPKLSANGRWLAYTTVPIFGSPPPNDFLRCAIRDFDTGSVEYIPKLPNLADQIGSCKGMSDDARIVAMITSLPLVDDDTNDIADYYAIERATGRISRISVGDLGQQLVTFGRIRNLFLASSGRYAVFETSDDNALTPDAPGGISLIYWVDLSADFPPLPEPRSAEPIPSLHPAGLALLAGILLLIGFAAARPRATSISPE